MNRESTSNPTRILEQVRDLRELRDIAQREHGPTGRSTQRIQEALTQAERNLENERVERTVKVTGGGTGFGPGGSG
jgi:hypothetical protein